MEDIIWGNAKVRFCSVPLYRNKFKAMLGNPFHKMHVPTYCVLMGKEDIDENGKKRSELLMFVDQEKFSFNKVGEVLSNHIFFETYNDCQDYCLAQNNNLFEKRRKKIKDNDKKKEDYMNFLWEEKQANKTSQIIMNDVETNMPKLFVNNPSYKSFCTEIKLDQAKKIQNEQVAEIKEIQEKGKEL